MIKRYGDFWSKVQRGNPSSCWPWHGAKTASGYGVVLYHGHNTTAHRVAFLLNGGTIPRGHVVMHSCDNAACCNPRHLQAATQKANIADMHAKGRAGDCRVIGERHGNAKLTDRQVRQIRALRVLRLTQQTIADLFGVGQAQISNILRGTSRAECATAVAT